MEKQLCKLGRILATMVNEDRRLPLRVELVSEYDKLFLTNTVLPATGGSKALLRKRRTPLAWLAGDSRGVSGVDRAYFSRCRLEIGDSSRWRYEELDEADQVTRLIGYNGEQCWAWHGGKLSVWVPVPPESPFDHQESMWQAHASLTLRSVVEPSLVLATTRIQRVTSIAGTYGPATRLDVAPRYATESSLVSPWAERSRIDVDDFSGMIVLAVNEDRDGSVLSRHSLTMLEQGAPLEWERFEPGISTD